MSPPVVPATLDAARYRTMPRQRSAGKRTFTFDPAGMLSDAGAAIKTGWPTSTT
jgi:hypothetical protein